MTTNERLCTVFRGSREAEMYLYVDRAEGLARVPDELLARFGVTSEVMTLKLHPGRRLARARAADVLTAIDRDGYYLQLPPHLQPPVYTQGG